MTVSARPPPVGARGRHRPAQPARAGRAGLVRAGRPSGTPGRCGCCARPPAAGWPRRRGGRAGRGQAAEHAEPARSRRSWPSGCSPAPGSVRWPRTRPDRRTVGVASALGVAGAAAGTYAGAYYRKLLPARTHTPDLPWAVGEDAVAAGLAATAIKVWPEPRPWWQRAPRALARAPQSRRPRAQGRRPGPEGDRRRAEGRARGSGRRVEGDRAGHADGGARSWAGVASRRRYGDVPAAVIGTAAEPG